VKYWVLRLFWRVETTAALALGWLLVFLVPFRHTAALIGKTRQSADAGPLPSDPAVLKRASFVTRRVDWLGDKMPFRTTCLVRAVAGWLLLTRRGIASTIRFGVAMENGKLAAHAWLIVHGESLLGGDIAEDYQPLADMGG